MRTKVCSQCGKEKPVSEYYRRSASPDGLNSACKTCIKAAARKRYRKNKAIEKIEQAQRADMQKESNLIRLYGITLEDYEHMFYEQGRACAICGRVADEFRRDLAVDHDHVTGKVRGLLCPDCNRGLGGFHDDIELIEKALQYLQKHSAQQ